MAGNLPQEAVEIYSGPLADKYHEIRLVKRGESLTAKSIPNLTIDADVILG
ncbi:MAG TPA: hypothetical protein VLJ61_10720 [Pyrinomonadaceae bacterium]|nr:hypothetical protein [Pyrinomonadaceae bacterium]